MSHSLPLGTNWPGSDMTPVYPSSTRPPTDSRFLNQQLKFFPNCFTLYSSLNKSRAHLRSVHIIILHSHIFSPFLTLFTCLIHLYSRTFSLPLHTRVSTVWHSYLPYLSCLFVTENSLVAAGYDCYPVLWMHDDNGSLTYINKLDTAEKKQIEFVRCASRYSIYNKTNSLSLSLSQCNGQVQRSGQASQRRWT